jgi:hypothetical protein
MSWEIMSTAWLEEQKRLEAERVLWARQKDELAERRAAARDKQAKDK